MLVDAPVLFPGRCKMCGRSDGRMVDTQIDDADDGRVYVCEGCAAVYAGLIGHVAAAEHDRVVDQVDRAMERIVEMEGEIAELRPVAAAVASAAARFGDSEAHDEPIRRRAA